MLGMSNIVVGKGLLGVSLQKTEIFSKIRPLVILWTISKETAAQNSIFIIL